jgi:hypothetical protein
VSDGERRGDERCYLRLLWKRELRAAFSIDGAARVAESRDGPDRPTANAGALEASPEPQHAFVGAFSAFNLSLLALGTPANLIRVSAAAALDEMFHPKACFALASRHTGRTLSPAELDISGLTLATDLVSAAEPTFAEGRTGGTSAALWRRQASSGATTLECAAFSSASPKTKRHVELASQLIAWAVQRSGDAVVPALSRALERATRGAAIACRGAKRTPEAWPHAGHLSKAESTSITERALHDIVRPVLTTPLDR